MFPKSGIDTDGYDIVTIETLRVWFGGKSQREEEQKKQNALLENAKESIQREMEAEVCLLSCCDLGNVDSGVGVTEGLVDEARCANEGLSSLAQ